MRALPEVSTSGWWLAIPLSPEHFALVELEQLVHKCRRNLRQSPNGRIRAGRLQSLARVRTDEADGAHAAGVRGFDADRRVFDDDAVRRGKVQALRRFQKDVWRGFAVL